MTNTNNIKDALYISSRAGTHPDGSWRRIQEEIHVGGTYVLSALHPGTQITIDGAAAVVVSRYPKTSLVRFHESQECPKLNGQIEAVVLDYDGWQGATAPVGSFVEVRSGEHQGRVGMVFAEGLNSTYVVFPGDRNRGHKFPCKDLIIRKDQAIRYAV